MAGDDRARLTDYPAHSLRLRTQTHPRLRSMMKSVVLASNGLLWVSSVPLMREAVRDPLTMAILVTTVVLLVLRKLDSLWIILGASVLELGAASTHLLSGL
jgi:chromate transporter